MGSNPKIVSSHARVKLCTTTLPGPRNGESLVHRLTGLRKNPVTLTWKGGNYSSVEISGLDIGWGQRMPLNLNEEQSSWTLERELPEGHYEYKYVVDGKWTCNQHELITSPNKDGHVNNYVQVINRDPNSENAELRKRLTGDDPYLTKEDRAEIREFLEACPEDEE